jgi:predicted Zn-dependent peptidase
MSARAALLALAALVAMTGAMAQEKPALPPLNAPSVKIPPYRRIVLPNGIVLLLLSRPEVPLTAFAAVLRAGAIGDPPGKAGLANLTANLLEKGAGSRDAFAFADAVANAGGSFSANAGPESITITGQFLARDRALMIELLSDAILRPRLDAAEFENLRDRERELLKAQKDSEPSSLIGTYGRAFLFGSHPYATPVDGSDRSLAGLTHADVTSYYRTRFGADRLTLVFAGTIDEKWLEAAVRKAFGGFARASAPLPALPMPPRQKGRRVLLVDSPGSVQTYFWIGNVGVPRRYPARAALDIVNTLYGGSFTSVLNTELRIKSGLSYSAFSGFTRGSVAGEFAISSFTQTENTGKALDVALQTLKDLHANGVDPARLEASRRYVLGQYPLRLETASNWASVVADLEFFGLERSYIEGYGPALGAVTLADTRRIVDEVFPSPDDVAIVLIGDAARIRETARKYGPVTEEALAAEDYLPPAQ